jgi:hypothetical protein
MNGAMENCFPSRRAALTDNPQEAGLLAIGLEAMAGRWSSGGRSAAVDDKRQLFAISRRELR